MRYEYEYENAKQALTPGTYSRPCLSYDLGWLVGVTWPGDNKSTVEKSSGAFHLEHLEQIRMFRELRYLGRRAGGVAFCGPNHVLTYGVIWSAALEHVKKYYLWLLSRALSIFSRAQWSIKCRWEKLDVTTIEKWMVWLQSEWLEDIFGLIGLFRRFKELIKCHVPRNVYCRIPIIATILHTWGLVETFVDEIERLECKTSIPDTMRKWDLYLSIAVDRLLILSTNIWILMTKFQVIADILGLNQLLFVG